MFNADRAVFTNNARYPVGSKKKHLLSQRILAVLKTGKTSAKD